jgi:hypothetical protein
MIKPITIRLQTAKQLMLLCCCVLSCSMVNAQFSPHNLVPNPSFEQYTNCPSNVTLETSRNSKPNIWYKPDLRDAVYYNACANNNIDGVPVNLGGGGKIINMPEQEMATWLCFITMA